MAFAVAESQTQPPAQRARTRRALIDCDFHNELDSIKDLYPYLAQSRMLVPGRVRVFGLSHRVFGRRARCLGAIAAAAMTLASCAPAAPAAPTPAAATAITAPAPAATSTAPQTQATPGTQAKPVAQPTSAPSASGAPDAEMQQLIEGAKKEGELNLYSVQSGDDLVRSDPEFKSMYPFLKVNRFRAEGEQLGAKLIAEARGGQYVADILDVDQNVSNAVAQAGLLMDYDPPERNEFDPQFKHTNFSGYRIQLKPIGFNTGLVPKDQAPKTYDDLLDPKWKGKLFMEQDEVSVFGAMTEFWGEDKTVDYFKKAAANGLQFRSGQTLVIQLLTAGEFPVGLSANLHSLEQEKVKGAPVEWVAQKDYFGNYGAVSIPKNAPHPNAAKLWVRYQLSSNGQEAVAATYRVPANPAVKPKAAGLQAGGYTIHTPSEKAMADYERLTKLFYEATGRPR